MTRKRKIALGVGGVLLLAFAYSAGQASTEEPATEAAVATPAASSPEPADSPSPTITLAPTSTPTAEPTATPTEEPTPTPTEEVAVNEDFTNYLDFLAFGVRYSKDIQPLLEDLSQALSDVDSVAAADVARDLLKVHQDAVAWLKAHPAAACYADDYDRLMTATTSFVKAAKAQVTWLDDYPFGSQDDYDTFTKYTQRGSDNLVSEQDGLTATCTP